MCRKDPKNQISEKVAVIPLKDDLSGFMVRMCSQKMCRELPTVHTLMRDLSV